MSPKLEHELEHFNYALTMSSFDPAKHLKEREEKYVMPTYMGGDILVVRETKDGWWRESIDFKSDPEKQIEKLKNDPTVAVGWFGTPRFRGNGGWS